MKSLMQDKELSLKLGNPNLNLFKDFLEGRFDIHIHAHPADE
jgi:hypothetical protein